MLYFSVHVQLLLRHGCSKNLHWAPSSLKRVLFSKTCTKRYCINYDDIKRRTTINGGEKPINAVIPQALLKNGVTRFGERTKVATAYLYFEEKNEIFNFTRDFFFIKKNTVNRFIDIEEIYRKDLSVR